MNSGLSAEGAGTIPGTSSGVPPPSGGGSAAVSSMGVGQGLRSRGRSAQHLQCSEFSV